MALGLLQNNYLGISIQLVAKQHSIRLIVGSFISLYPFDDYNSHIVIECFFPCCYHQEIQE